MQKKVCVALRDLLSFFAGTMCFHVSLVLGELSAVFHMFHALLCDVCADPCEAALVLVLFDPKFQTPIPLNAHSKTAARGFLDDQPCYSQEFNRLLRPSQETAGKTNTHKFD